MLAGCVSHLSLFCAVDQILDRFRDRFLEEMNARDIVHHLRHYKLISDSTAKTVIESPDAIEGNHILYAYLKATSTRDSLKTVCDMIIAVRSNPRMRAFGEDMKRELEGKCCVCHTYMRAHMHVCMCGFVCTDDPNLTIPLSLYRLGVVRKE